MNHRFVEFGQRMLEAICLLSRKIKRREPERSLGNFIRSSVLV
jgi:hypothetical protein